MAKRQKLTTEGANEWYWKTMRGRIEWSHGEYSAGQGYHKRYHWDEIGKDVEGRKTVLEIGKVYQYNGKPYRPEVGHFNWQYLWRVTRTQNPPSFSAGIDTAANWVSDEQSYFTTVVKGYTYNLSVAGVGFSESTEPYVYDLTEDAGGGNRIGVIVYSPLVYLHGLISAYAHWDASVQQRVSITLRLRVRQRTVDPAWYMQKNLQSQGKNVVMTFEPDDAYV